MESTIPPSCDALEQTTEMIAPVKIVLACENNAGFQAARKIYRAIVRRLTGRFEFRERWLSFDALAEPASLERAADAAAEAEMVFCCPGNPYLLAARVQDWIRLWLARRTQPDGALVLLLPTMTESVSRQTLMERDLRETARVAGLDFFAAEYTVESPRVYSPATKIPVAFEESSDVVGILQGRSSARNWAINE